MAKPNLWVENKMSIEELYDDYFVELSYLAAEKEIAEKEEYESWQREVQKPAKITVIKEYDKIRIES